MLRLIIGLVVLLFAGLPVGAFAQEPTEGTISGQVINGTEGGGSVAEIEVTLIAYVDDMISVTRTVRTDGEGKFQFYNVALEPEYLVTTKYMEVDYYNMVVFEPGESTVYVELGVCDTTNNDEAIMVGLAHKIFSIEEDSLKVTEVFWMFNDGDRTYVGADGVLVFTLPDGARDFEAPQEMMPDYRFLDDGRLTYLVPFPPGERQLVFSYCLAKPDAAEFTVTLEIDYPTEALELLVQGEGIEVTVSQLAPAEPVVTDAGERFIHFRGENLPRGCMIDLALSGLSGGGGFPLFILWIIIAVVVIGIAVYMIRRMRKVSADD
jgi:hypothetical protein